MSERERERERERWGKRERERKKEDNLENFREKNVSSCLSFYLWSAIFALFMRQG